MSKTDKSEGRPASAKIIEQVAVGDEPAKSSLEQFLEDVLVLCDGHERELLISFYQADHHLGDPFVLASRTEDPKTFRQQLNAIRIGMKAMISLLKELDMHRFGGLADHRNFGESSAAASLKEDGLEELKNSDLLLAKRIIDRIDCIKALCDFCERECRMLNCLEFRDLLPCLGGVRFRADRRNWATEFTTLYFKLRKFASELDIKMSGRASRRHYVHQLVAKASLSKARDKQTNTNGAGAAIEATKASDNVVTLFAIAPDVAKARAG